LLEGPGRRRSLADGRRLRGRTAVLAQSCLSWLLAERLLHRGLVAAHFLLEWRSAVRNR
jgi:hypothetical protein